LCGVLVSTPESLLHVSRHSSQDMCAITSPNTVLEIFRKLFKFMHIN
jgi:hypothetical protein